MNERDEDKIRAFTEQLRAYRYDVEKPLLERISELQAELKILHEVHQELRLNMITCANENDRLRAENERLTAEYAVKTDGRAAIVDALRADKVKKSDYDKVIAAIESGKAPAPATDDGDPGPEHSQKV